MMATDKLTKLQDKRRKLSDATFYKNQANKNALYKTQNDKLRQVIEDRFIASQRLAQTRQDMNSEIDRLNKEFISQTEGTLNKQALDFLMKNAMINVPTLTSIFAGWELAKASRTDRLREERDLNVDKLKSDFENTSQIIQNELKLNESQNELNKLQIEQQLNTLKESTAYELGMTTKEYNEQLDSLNKQINQQNELEKIKLRDGLKEDPMLDSLNKQINQLQNELEKIKLRDGLKEDPMLDFFNNQLKKSIDEKSGVPGSESTTDINQTGDITTDVNQTGNVITDINPVLQYSNLINDARQIFNTTDSRLNYKNPSYNDLTDDEKDRLDFINQYQFGDASLIDPQPFIDERSVKFKETISDFNYAGLNPDRLNPLRNEDNYLASNPKTVFDLSNEEFLKLKADAISNFNAGLNNQSSGEDVVDQSQQIDVIQSDTTNNDSQQINLGQRDVVLNESDNTATPNVIPNNLSDEVNAYVDSKITDGGKYDYTDYQNKALDLGLLPDQLTKSQIDEIEKELDKNKVGDEGI